MANEWYYKQEDKRKGPVSLQQLKQLADSGKLRPADTVWQPGMKQWVSVDSIKDLFPVNEPAEPTEEVKTHLQSKEMKAGVRQSQPTEQELVPRIKKGLKVGGAGVAVLLLIGLLFLLFRSPSIAAVDLCDTYKRSQAIADQQYAGKVLQVSGTISSVEEQPESTVIRLDAGLHTGNVLCFLEKEKANQTKGLTAGQQIKIKGMCEGINVQPEVFQGGVGDVVLRKCVIR